METVAGARCYIKVSQTTFILLLWQAWNVATHDPDLRPLMLASAKLASTALQAGQVDAPAAPLTDSRRLSVLL